MRKSPVSYEVSAKFDILANVSGVPRSKSSYDDVINVLTSGPTARLGEKAFELRQAYGNPRLFFDNYGHGHRPGAPSSTGSLTGCRARINAKLQSLQDAGD